MNLSKTIANHVVSTNFKDIPKEVVEVQKRALLDGIAVLIAAQTLGDGCRAFIDFAIENGGKEDSTIFGFDSKVPAFMAAFANASMSHSLDFEDAHDFALVHSNAASMPAALAIAEAKGNVSGEELLTAMILGSDLVCRMGLTLNDDLLKDGWYMPPVLNAFGTTVAVGKLLNLSQSQMLDALSLTLCQATCSSELTNNAESPIRSVRDAFGAKIGVMSAQLAQRGIIGFKEPFEGSRGFYHAFARGNCDLTKLTDKLGVIYESGNISFKPWPSCRGTHPNIDAIRQILSKHHIIPEDITRVHLVISSVNAKLLCEPMEVKKKPESPINAKFSLPFTVATALVHGNVTLDHFNESTIKDSRVLKLSEKITYEIDETFPKHKSLQSITTIYTKDNVFSQAVSNPLGCTENPMGDDALIEKFMNCLKYSAKKYSKEKSKKLANMILNIDALENINELIEYL